MQQWHEPRPNVADRPERRGRNREHTLPALGALLDAVRRDAEFEAVALADPAGILVAGAGSSRSCEEMAAIAPLALRAAAANDVVPTRFDAMTRRLRIKRLSVDGVEVLVCGEGGSEEGLSRAAAGCARILGRSAPALP